MCGMRILSRTHFDGPNCKLLLQNPRLRLRSAKQAESWNFSVRVGIVDKTANYYGGFVAVAQKVKEQFEYIILRFASSCDLLVAFEVTDIYQASGWSEVFKQHPDLNHVFIIDGFPSRGGGWYGS